MSIKSFLQSLVPHFERNRIIEDIDGLAVDLESSLIPSYEAANKLFAGKKFASKPGTEMQSLFKIRHPQERGVSFISFTLSTLKNLLETLKMIERLVQEIFARDVTKDGLTFKKVAVLQFLTAARFYCDYAGRYLLRVIEAETLAQKAGDTSGRLDATLLPVDLKFFNEGFEAWLQAAHLMAMPTAELAEKLGNMQDLQVVADRISVITATVGVDQVDPLKLGFLGAAATSSPVYLLRSAFARWQVAAHTMRKEEAKMVQLKLFQLKDAYAGRNDPKIQEQIEYNEGRLARLREELANFEERYGS
ncbi:hypothetical protein LUCX_107 [Xanthomonas phage vB_XciM_LucasX]|nr:hypothetical protein LUCX_107 [Xanthomonas phage vB_XciM_LucasX]